MPPPGTLLCSQIPVRTEHWDVEGPGFIEADTVAHCGESMTGEFCWSSPGLPGSTPPASPSRRYRCPSRPIPTQWLHSSTPAQRHRIDLQRPRHCLPPRLAPHRDLPLHGRQCSAPHTSPRLLAPIRGKLPIDLRRADLRYLSLLSHLQFSVTPPPRTQPQRQDCPGKPFATRLPRYHPHSLEHLHIRRRVDLSRGRGGSPLLPLPALPDPAP